MREKTRITITISPSVLDAVDAMVLVKRKKALQADQPVNRSTFIEMATTHYLETQCFENP